VPQLNLSDGQYREMLEGSVFTHREGDSQGKLRLVLRSSLIIVELLTLYRRLPLTEFAGITTL
jgi:hypothetical protein